MFSAELQAKMNIWRAKIADGTIEKSELIEAVKLLREERKSAVESAGKRKARATSSVQSAEDLLKALE